MSDVDSTTTVILTSTANNTTLPDLYVSPEPFNTIGVLMLLVALVGNCIICEATIMSPALRSKASLLIGINAGSNIIFIATSMVIHFLNYIQEHNITQFKCFLYEAPHMFAVESNTAIIMMLGVDRLISVIAPIK